MNKSIKYIILGLCGLTTLASCQKEFDDITPNGSIISAAQVKDNALISQDTKEAGINGLYSMLTARVVYDSQHDFGYPAYALYLEHAGDNVVSSTHGYNWFREGALHDEFSDQKSYATNMWWTFSYKNIKVANELLDAFASAQDEAAQRIAGEAYTMRAWNYFNLARLYQHTYVGHQTAPCVPIVKEDTPNEVVNNNPRATVEQVYSFILEDLNAAVAKLQGYKPTVKNRVSEAVAYGVRARVYLTMNKYAEAAADAQKAIDLSGATPFTIEDCSIPNFDDVQTAKNVMWGIIIGNEDVVTKSGIANYTSMFNSLSFGATAYTTTVNQYKRINTRLYEKIPATDVRKGWWTAEPLAGAQFFTSPLIRKAYPNAVMALANKMFNYSAVKFAPNNKNINDPIHAVDYVLMRVEEMYYIKAEALAKSGNYAGGKQVLEDFEKAYRNPSFVSVSTDAESLQEEIYTIKRYEFWGEGISWFDMKRLNKGVDRVDVATNNHGGYPERTRFNIAPGESNLIFQIPESELQTNRGITENNPPVKLYKDLF